jgi:integrase
MGSIRAYETQSGRRYRVQYRTPEHRLTSKRGFRTKGEADRYLATVEVAKMRGEWVAPSRSRATVGELAELWFSAQMQVKPTTRLGYRQALDKHVLSRWGNTRLVDVSHGEVQAWVAKLSDALGPSIVRQNYLVLAGILKFAVRDNRLTRNVAEHVQLPRLIKRKHGYLSHRQVRALATECGEWSDLVLTLAYTGLRWGEAVALAPEHVDLAKGRFDVARAVSTPGGLVTWGTPKNHKRRSVPFPALLMESLQLRLGSTSKLVFSAPAGGVLHAGNFRSRVFYPALERCVDADSTFPRVTIHDLRHTAASLAVSAGANVKAVQRMLGHASAAMTLDVYADLFDDDLDDVADALDRQARDASVAESQISADGKTTARSTDRRRQSGRPVAPRVH